MTLTSISYAMRCKLYFQQILGEKFAGVKLRGYTVAGSEEVKQPAGVEYKNISEGYDEQKSIEAKKDWMLKEKERKRSYKEVKKVKKIKKEGIR